MPAHTLTLDATAGKELRVLVSNEGRQSGELVSLSKNGKGILGGSTQPPTLSGVVLGAMNATHLDLPEPASAWAKRLNWGPSGTARSRNQPPAFFKATLTGAGPEATFLVMDGWGHGVVFVNDVNIGRFTCLGPGRTLYVPTGVLTTGENTIVIFESDRLGAPEGMTRTIESVAAGPLWNTNGAMSN